jgi:hypothetical protein
MPRQKVRAGRFLVSSRLLKTACLGALFLVLMSYLGWQVKGIIEPPALVVFEPADGATTSEPKMSVAGVVEGEANVFVNGNIVLPNPDGSFSTTITLERGYNLITVEGKKRYSRSETIKRSVLLGRPQDGATPLSQGPQKWYSVGAR